MRAWLLPVQPLNFIDFKDEGQFSAAHLVVVVMMLR